MSYTAIDAQTAAATFDFYIPPGATARVTQHNLGASETVDVQFPIAGGYDDLYQDGSQVQLTSTNNAVTVNGPGYFRLNKGVTSAGVTVDLDRNPI